MEGLPSKGISLYDQSQQKVAQVLKIDVSHTNAHHSNCALSKENANWIALNLSPYVNTFIE